MFDFIVNRKSLDDWKAGISRLFIKEFEISSQEIRRDWTTELYRQSESHGDGLWQPLNPMYLARKEKDFAKGRKGVISLDPLQRTGQMLAGYIAGIEVERSKSKISISMPYPTGNDYITGKPLSVRAQSHQGEIRTPKGVVPRPFDVERFEDIALVHLNDAISRAAEKSHE